MAFDDGYAVHYLSLKRGTPVLSSEEEVVGKVVEVRDNHKENFLDGIVIEAGGRRRFVDAPEVARTAERAVTLTITAAEVEQLPGPPPKGMPLRRRVSRFLRAAYRSPPAEPPQSTAFTNENENDDDK